MSRSSFWELHRQLADCYVADMASLNGNGPNRQISPGSMTSPLPMPMTSPLLMQALRSNCSGESSKANSVLPRRYSLSQVSRTAQRSHQDDLDELAGSRRSGEDERFSEQILPQRRESHHVLYPGPRSITATLRSQRSHQDDLDELAGSRKHAEDERFSEQILPQRRLSNPPPPSSALHKELKPQPSRTRMVDCHSSPDLINALEDKEMATGPEAKFPEAKIRNNTPSLMTLLELQGLAVPEDGEITKVMLKPHGCWKTKQVQGFRSGTIRSRKILWNASTKANTSGEQETSTDSCWRQMWLHPSGGFRGFWNSVVALLVLYDLLLIPMTAFDVPRNDFMRTMDIGMPIFWCLDFVLTFFTGYYQHGQLIVDIKSIARTYATSWMLYDLSLIIMDFIFVILDYFLPSVFGVADWSRSLLMLRFLRLVRIMRAIKLRRGFAAFQDLLHSPATSLYLGFLINLGQLLILNHWMACAWYGIRWLHPDNNWVVKSGMDENEWPHQYLMCMLWSFCQLGVGESPLQPTNTTEMLLNCVIAFRSLITSATLISTMSNLIAGLRSLREDEATQFRLLRRFLAQNHIPHDVCHKVTQFLQHQFAKHQQSRSSDQRVPILDLLSGPLFRELQFERHRASLCKLPMLKDLLEAPDIQTLETLHSATRSLYQLVAATRDIIFLSGSRATSAYFKLGGTLVYYRDQGEQIVDDSLWVAEACLWTPWIHMGDFEAKSVSDLLCLDADSFCETLAKTWSTQLVASAYAVEFLAAMHRDHTWSDIYVDADRDSVNGSEEPLADLPLRTLCWGFCPRSFKKRGESAKVQSIVPDQTFAEPDLT